ncbi:MAG: SGNH/GDSL hydrolase family protein [Pseudomonadales bacterium]|nr:SGNH/GDSL hydrolase family protein [Pseudomonadales bacterium]
MKQILVYGDSLSWGIIPGSRHRQPFNKRWPGVLEQQLIAQKEPVRVIENCLNGRRTVWNDPFKAGRDGSAGLAQVIELNSPLALVVIMLGTNDFMASHSNNAWLSAQGIQKLITAIRQAPVEPGMPVPAVLIVVPPKLSPQGNMRDKFLGGENRSIGLSEAYREVAETNQAGFFDAGNVVSSSKVDGVHLDAPDHRLLGDALAEVILNFLQRGSWI